MLCSESIHIMRIVIRQGESFYRRSIVGLSSHANINVFDTDIYIYKLLIYDFLYTSMGNVLKTGNC